MAELKEVSLKSLHTPIIVPSPALSCAYLLKVCQTDTVMPEQIAELKAIVRSLQKDAVIVEAQNGEVPMEELLDTDR